MNRIDRLTAILIHLQGKSRVTIEELEDRFEVSRRTIFRDVKSLMESGVPIGGEAGQGYFIVEGYHLPPVVFNKGEAAALLLASKLIDHHTDSETVRLMEEAMRKVRAVLRYSDRDYLESLDSKIAILNPRSIFKQEFPDSNITEIQLALASKKAIEISYYSNYNESTTNRQVEPLGLVYYSNRWHLIAYCRLREDLRDFRTDRIQKLTITREDFRPEDHPDFLEFVNGMTGGTDVKKAVIRFSKKMARFVGEQKYQYGFLEETKVGDEVEMVFLTPNYVYLAHWILSFSNEVTVISPSELQGLAASFSSTLFEHHRKYFEVVKPLLQS